MSVESEVRQQPIEAYTLNGPIEGDAQLEDAAAMLNHCYGETLSHVFSAVGTDWDNQLDTATTWRTLTTLNGVHIADGVTKLLLETRAQPAGSTSPTVAFRLGDGTNTATTTHSTASTTDVQTAELTLAAGGTVNLTLEVQVTGTALNSFWSHILVRAVAIPVASYP